MYGIQNGSNTIWLQLNAIILASKNRRKELRQYDNNSVGQQIIIYICLLYREQNVRMTKTKSYRLLQIVSGSVRYFI